MTRQYKYIQADNIPKLLKSVNEYNNWIENKEYAARIIHIEYDSTFKEYIAVCEVGRSFIGGTYLHH